MTFRKRNSAVVGIAPGSNSQTSTVSSVTPSGCRASPVDGRPTTSSGTQSLDELLAGHGAIPLGTSVILQENGTADYSGVFSRYFAAEGIAQGHHVHILGAGEQWVSHLPAVASTSEEDDRRSRVSKTERMNIAWRYDSLAKQSPRTSITSNGTHQGEKVHNHIFRRSSSNPA